MSDKTWRKTNVSNLIRYVPSGVYFARFKAGGKLYRYSLETTVMSVAKVKLADEIKRKREAAGAGDRAKRGRMKMADCFDVVTSGVEVSGNRKRSNEYRLETIELIRRTWKDVDDLYVANITPETAKRWFQNIRDKYSAHRANNTLSTFRWCMRTAMEAGAIHRDPTASIKRERPRQKILDLPTGDQFRDFVAEIRRQGKAHSDAAGDLVEFLAYSGCRIGEAREIRWKHISEERGEIIVTGGEGGTKGGEGWRIIPIVPAMKTLLKEIRERREGHFCRPEDKVLAIKQAKDSMANAADRLGMAHMTHHDLRHLFVSRALQSGVPVATVASWAGHRDNGALILKVYSHLIGDHSQIEAQKVEF